MSALLSFIARPASVAETDTLITSSQELAVRIDANLSTELCI